MAKTRDQLNPNYAPVYTAAMYPELAKICQEHGFALAVHGSVARDFDIIAIPWAKEVSSPNTLLAAICKKYAVDFIGHPTVKEHGRVAYTLSVGFGECSLDFSFFPGKFKSKWRYVAEKENTQ